MLFKFTDVQMSTIKTLLLQVRSIGKLVQAAQVHWIRIFCPFTKYRKTFNLESAGDDDFKSPGYCNSKTLAIEDWSE